MSTEGSNGGGEGNTSAEERGLSLFNGSQLELLLQSPNKNRNRNRNRGVGSDYHLPMPPEHRLESANGLQLPPGTQEIQFQGLGFYQQQGILGIHPNPHDTEDSSSSCRNVRMRMTLQDNSLPVAYGELRLGSCSENPNPRPIRNSVYDPMYEAMGLPVDPHLRMFIAKRNQGSN